VLEESAMRVPSCRHYFGHLPFHLYYFFYFFSLCLQDPPSDHFIVGHVFNTSNVRQCLTHRFRVLRGKHCEIRGIRGGGVVTGQMLPRHPSQCTRQLCHMYIDHLVLRELDDIGVCEFV
jgi:hypothetical protein